MTCTAQVRLPGRLLLAACLVGCCSNPVLPTTPAEFVYFQRTGGLLGFDDELTVYDDRSAVSVRRQTNASRRFTVSQSTYQALRQQLGGADFAQLPDAGDSVCCDQILYTVRHAGHTVRASDSQMPPTLTVVVETLSRLIDEH